MPQQVDLQALLGDTLLVKDAAGGVKSVPTGEALAGKTVGVYFSAHWCGPCRQFTPLLSRTFAKLRGEGKQFEVVFVSSDRSQAQFEEYFASMGAWTAVPFADTAARRRASSHFSVMGIPTLVIVGPDGQVLTTNGRGALARDPGGEGFPWEGAQEGVVQGLLNNRLVLLLLFVAFWKLTQWLMGLLRG